MTETRKIIRAFLASPGDLQEERIAIFDVIKEWNETWAAQLGYQVELVGWEATLPGYGRPQEIINQDLDRCELFVGMMWKKWGTPSDTEGNYTSGFHEEFDLSIKRRKETGRPEICMFFKKVSDEIMSDPGQDLTKVLEFKGQIIDNKTILFQEFTEIREIESLVRKRISGYIQKVIEEVSVLGADEDNAKREISNDHQNTSKPIIEVTSPLSLEGFRFLEDFVSRVQHAEAMGNISACDIARFRLLSNTISKSGNDNPTIGVHDINILFANKNQLDLGAREIYALTKLGLQNLGNENAPLWYWYSRQKDKDMLFIDSAFGESNERKAGAVTVLDRLGKIIPEDYFLPRDSIISKWFSDESSAGLKNAAINYLANNGQISDLEYIKAEYERSDSSTSRKSLEGMISISLRILNDTSAAKLVLESQFYSLEPDILHRALKDFEQLTNDDLLIGTDHHNVEVRLRALVILYDRNALAERLLKKYLEDSAPEIRYRALTISAERGQVLSDSDVRNILIKRRHGRVGIGLLALAPGSDEEGKEYFERYTLEQLRKLGEKVLIDEVNKSLILDDDSYFVLVEKYFTKWSEDLRKNLDEKFVKYFSDKLRKLEARNVNSELDDTIQKLKEFEDMHRKDITRKGLNILCRKRKLEDLARIRNNLESGYTEISIYDVGYIGKNGGWDDIQLLANSKKSTSASSVLITSIDNDFEEALIQTIYKIGRSNISGLFSLDISADIQSKLLSVCSESVFKNISNDVFFNLLNSELATVRKEASLKAVRSFPITRIKDVLNEYVSGDRYRYYNVIHWLDLGASMPRLVAKRVATTASK